MHGTTSRAGPVGDRGPGVTVPAGSPQSLAGHLSVQRDFTTTGQKWAHYALAGSLAAVEVEGGKPGLGEALAGPYLPFGAVFTATMSPGRAADFWAVLQDFGAHRLDLVFEPPAHGC